jgi:uncharacterized protein YuzE
VSVRIGDHEFEHATYDEVGDVLYLRNGEPKPAASTYGTPEGHAVRLDEDGKIIGLTIVNARWLLEQEKGIAITIPQQRIEAPAGDVGAALERSVSKRAAVPGRQETSRRCSSTRSTQSKYTSRSADRMSTS